MAINYFIGWNQQDLEGELRVAQEDLAAGKATIMAQAGEARSGSQMEETAQNRIKMILRALNKLDPENYPVDQITAITSTRVCFS
jgi:hypothetical protein